MTNNRLFSIDTLRAIYKLDNVDETNTVIFFLKESQLKD